jgi:hypothetical protein
MYVERRTDMSTSDEQMQELAHMINETGQSIAEQYYHAFFQFLAKLGSFSETDGPRPVPLKVWGAIAQAFADSSGYRIVLQAEIHEPIEGEPDCYRTVGHREVFIADSMVFADPAEE